MFLTSTLLMAAPATAITELCVFHLGWFAFCMAAFMPGPRNMHAVRNVSSY